VQAVTADMGAIRLLKDHSKTLSDPASVIYIKNIGETTGGKYYDLQAQGTGVYEMINYYVYAAWVYDSYQVYAEGKYLVDSNTGTGDEGRMDIKSSGDKKGSKKWKVSKIDSSTDEYFGITPSVSVQNRYFHPFYADFGFSLKGEGMKVWLVKEVNKNAVVIAPFEGSTVPAQTPVIIECGSSKVSSNKIDLVFDTVATNQANALSGVFFNNAIRNNRVAFDSSSMRVLGVMSDGKLGYVLSKDTPDSETGLQYLGANQSYLPVESGLPDEIPVMTESEYAEWVAASVSTATVAERKKVYSLSGKNLGTVAESEINSLPAGIYIIGQKKVVVY
ncbi:MAG: hypothetical protein ACSW76_08160, partial [Bacteroidaceae bacterium]